MQAFKFAAVASFAIIASLASAVTMAADEQAAAPVAKPKKLTTDLYIEGGVDRTKMSESWIKAHENDVIGMAHPSKINQSGQGYPDIRP